VEHHEFAQRPARGALRLNQYLDVRLGAEEAALYGKEAIAARTPPEMRCDGLRVRVSEEWFKGHGGRGNL
jgi:hypothetical protein